MSRRRTKQPEPRPADPPQVARLDRSPYWLLAILAATVAIYWRAQWGEFVYDDRFQILRNASLRDASNWVRLLGEGVWQFASDDGATSGNYYRPLFNLTLLAGWQLFGEAVRGWHWISFGLYLGVITLLFALVREWSRDAKTALVAALVFAVHPLHSESVAWISGMPDLLAGLFAMVAALLYERARSGSGRQLARRAGWATAFLLALLAKETAVALALFLAWRELFENPGERASLLELLRRLAPAALAVAVYLAARWQVMGFLSRPDVRNAGVGAGDLLLSLPAAVTTYLRLLVWPHPLAISYPFEWIRSPASPRFWLSALAIGGIVTLVVRRLRDRTARRGIVWFGCFLAPALALRAFNPMESLLHDRYLFLPSIGFCAAAAVGWRVFERRWPRAAGAGLALVALTLAVLTVRQNATWSDDLTFARQALARRPESAFFHNYLGAILTERQEFVAAEPVLREARRLSPGYADAAGNLGNLLFLQGRHAEAEPVYREALALGGVPVDIRFNLALVLIQLGRLADSETTLHEVLLTRPGWPEAWYSLGWVRQALHEDREAELSYRQALRLRPAYVEARINLSELLRAAGRREEAISLVRDGLVLQPGEPRLARRLASL